MGICSRIGLMLKKIKSKFYNVSAQAKASFCFLTCAFLQKSISVITTPIITRILSTAEYGQYNIFNSWLGILTVLVTLNLNCGIYTRGLVTFEKDRNVFSSSLQGLTLTLVLIWLVIYISFITFWNSLFSLTTQQMILMFILIWATSVFGFWSMNERVDFNYRKLIVVTFAISLTKPIFGIMFAVLSKDKVTAYLFGLACSEMIICIALFYDQMQKGRVFYSKKYWKHGLMFNIPLIPHYLSTTVLNSADRIMIGDMVGESAAGIYGLAYSISLIMTVFNTALTQTIEPWLYKKIHAKHIEDISRIVYPALVLIALVNIILIAMAPEVIAIFAPGTYYDAIWVIPPVAMSAFFMFSYHLFSVFEFYFKKTKFIAAATCAGAVLNIILNYFFINIFGYYAAGYTTLFCYIVYAACHFFFMRKICKKYLDNQQPYNLLIYLSMACIFLLIGFVFLLTYQYAFVRYFLLSAMLAIIFLFRKRIVEEINCIISIKKTNIGA